MICKAVIHATLLTMDKQEPLLSDAYLRIEGKYISEIGKMENFQQKEKEEIIDAQNGIVMPGFINLHTHLSMIPFRGLGDDTLDRLRRFLIPMEKKWMDKELVYLAAKYAIAEELLNGVTTVVDMYYFEEEVMKAAKEMGIRGFFGETLMEEATPSFPNPQAALQHIQQKLLPLENEKVKVCIAPHGTHTCSCQTLKEAKKLAEEKKLLFTLHTAEMDYEMNYFKENYHCSPVAFLEKEKLLDERSLLAHCIHLNEEDRYILSQTKARIAHCIGANTKSAKGIAPISECVKEGILIGLGTDGPSSGNTLDIITQLKLVANFHKYITKDRGAWPCVDILQLATIKAAECLSLQQQLGSLEIGKEADFLIIETESVNMFPIYDPHSTMVYSANASNVKDVFIAGEQLVKDKQLLHHSLIEIRKELLEKMKKTEFRPLINK